MALFGLQPKDPIQTGFYAEASNPVFTGDIDLDGNDLLNVGVLSAVATPTGTPVTLRVEGSSAYDMKYSYSGAFLSVTALLMGGSNGAWFNSRMTAGVSQPAFQFTATSTLTGTDSIARFNGSGSGSGDVTIGRTGIVTAAGGFSSGGDVDVNGNNVIDVGIIKAVTTAGTPLYLRVNNDSAVDLTYAMGTSSLSNTAFLTGGGTDGLWLGSRMAAASAWPAFRLYASSSLSGSASLFALGHNGLLDAVTVSRLGLLNAAGGVTTAGNVIGVAGTYSGLLTSAGLTTSAVITTSAGTITSSVPTATNAIAFIFNTPDYSGNTGTKIFDFRHNASSKLTLDKAGILAGVDATFSGTLAVTGTVNTGTLIGSSSITATSLVATNSITVANYIATNGTAAAPMLLRIDGTSSYDFSYSVIAAFNLTTLLTGGTNGSQFTSRNAAASGFASFNFHTPVTVTGATTYLASFSHTGGTKIIFNKDGSPGFWGNTSIATTQPTAGSGGTSGWTSVGGSAVLSNSTWTGGTGSTAYTVHDLVFALKKAGLIVT